MCHLEMLGLVLVVSGPLPVTHSLPTLAKAEGSVGLAQTLQASIMEGPGQERVRCNPCGPGAPARTWPSATEGATLTTTWSESA